MRRITHDGYVNAHMTKEEKEVSSGVGRKCRSSRSVADVQATHGTGCANYLDGGAMQVLFPERSVGGGNGVRYGRGNVQIYGFVVLCTIREKYTSQHPITVLTIVEYVAFRIIELHNLERLAEWRWVSNKCNMANAFTNCKDFLKVEFHC